MTVLLLVPSMDYPQLTRQTDREMVVVEVSILEVLVLGTQSCLTLCDPMDCSPPGSSVCEILQARILEWVAISFSRGSSGPGIEPRSPALQADALPTEPLWT